MMSSMSNLEQNPKQTAKYQYTHGLVEALKQILAYRKFSGMTAWILHRLSGIGLVIYLILHINGLKALYDPVQFDIVMSAYRSPLFKFGEFILLALVVYHSINGVRIVLIDVLGWTVHQKRLYVITIALSLLLLILGGYPIIAPYFINPFLN